MKRELTPAMKELLAAMTEADQLSTRAEITKREDSRLTWLMAKIAALRSGVMGENKMYDDTNVRWFKALLNGGDPRPELRNDIVEGTQVPTYTAGSEGGYTVPNEFSDTLMFGIAKYDPLMDENVVTLLQSKTLQLRPWHQPSWDLSTFKAVKVSEAAQQTPLSVMNASTSGLNGYMYRATLDASFELEADDFQPTIDQIGEAYKVAFARGIGQDLVIGNGTSAPQGLLTAAVNSGVTLSTGFTGHNSNTENDQFQAAYFSVDAAYREAPKCAWAMSDPTYQWIRKLTDSQGRPLLEIRKDKEMLMGKPVYICPSVPSVNSSLGSYGKIIFGDFSRLVVRCSRMVIARDLQAPGYVEYGKALYIGRMRADARIVDPTNGAVPPFTYITLTT